MINPLSTTYKFTPITSFYSSFKSFVTYPFELPKKFYNLYRWTYKGESSKPLSNFCTDLNTLKFPRTTWHFTNHPGVVQYMLSESADEHFKPREIDKKLDQLFSEILPCSTAEDCILYHTPSKESFLKKPIESFLSQVQFQPEELTPIFFYMEELIDKKTPFQQVSMFYVISLISIYGLGLRENSVEYLKLASAIDSLEQSIKNPAIKLNTYAYQSNIEKIRDMLTLALDRQGELVSNLLTEKFSNQQIKRSLLLLLFAGANPTASQITNFTKRLSRNRGQATLIRRELKYQNSYELNKFILSSLRDLRPSEIFARQATCDLTLKIINPRLNQTIQKGDWILSCPSQINRRFHELPLDAKELPTLPFGYGPHQCPAHSFAVNSMKSFFTWFFPNYTITKSQLEPFEIHKIDFSHSYF